MKALSQSIIRLPQVALVNWVVFGGVSLIISSYVILLTLEPLVAQQLASEDSLIEDLGAAFLLVAFSFLLLAYIKSSGTTNCFFGARTKRNVWLLLLALLMLVCLGEEISWGQRLFGWNTPSGFKPLNAQQETNLHNLWIFHAKHPDGSRKNELALLLNANRLLSIFWLVYCVAIPLLVTFSRGAGRLVSFFGFPVARFAVGTLFILNFAMFRFIATHENLDRDTLAAFDELKETNYEFAFFVLALCFFMHFAVTRSSGLRPEFPISP